MVKNWYYQNVQRMVVKSRFIKHQEAKGLLSNLGARTPLSKVPILGDILFWSQFHWMQLLNSVPLEFKMNEYFLLTGDKYMSEMYLRQPGFVYSACRPFTKKKERIQNFKETGDANYIYQKKTWQGLFSAWHGLWILKI